MHITFLISRLDTAGADHCRHRRLADVFFIQSDDTFDVSETAANVVPEVPDDKFDSRIRWIEMPVSSCHLSAPFPKPLFGRRFICSRENRFILKSHENLAPLRLDALLTLKATRIWPNQCGCAAGCEAGLCPRRYSL